MVIWDRGICGAGEGTPGGLWGGFGDLSSPGGVLGTLTHLGDPLLNGGFGGIWAFGGFSGEHPERLRKGGNAPGAVVLQVRGHLGGFWGLSITWRGFRDPHPTGGSLLNWGTPLNWGIWGNFEDFGGEPQERSLGTQRPLVLQVRADLGGFGGVLGTPSPVVTQQPQDPSPERFLGSPPQTNDLSSVHLGVKFSCRFSLREIQERWYALLYDPVVCR